MNSLFRKVISLTLTFCLIVVFASMPVIAKTGKIKVDGQQYEIVVNNQNIITVKQNYQGYEIFASLDKQTNDVTAEVVEKPNNLLGIGKSKKHKYHVEVHDMDEYGNIKAIAKDVNTYQVIKIGDDSPQEVHQPKAVAQAPLVLIPLGSILGSLLSWLFAAAATITILGVTYTLVSDIASELKNNKNHDYYQAKIANGDVWVAGAFENRAAALSYLKASTSNDIFARTESLARSIAGSVASSAQYCTLPHYTDGYYPHYHPYRGNIKLNNHVFYFS